MIAGFAVAVGLVALVWTVVASVTGAWQYQQDASNDRKGWNAAILDQLVGSTPNVARALDTPEPTLPQWLAAPAFRVPPWCSTGTVTAVWVDR